MGDAEIADATALFADAFNAERTVIECIASCRKPEMDALQSLLAPVGDLMTRVGAKSEGRRTDAFNHLKALAEASQCLSFVAYLGPDAGMSLPGPHVTETWQSAEFYANKVLVQHRNTEGATPPAASVLAPGVEAVVLAAAGAPACASRRAATASRRATRDSMFTAMTTFL